MYITEYERSETNSPLSAWMLFDKAANAIPWERMGISTTVLEKPSPHAKQ